MDIKDIEDPHRLHEVIDCWSRVNDPMFRAMAAEEAARFAGQNAGLVDADLWLRRAVEMVARGTTLQGLAAQADPNGGLRRTPSPGRALVITPHNQSAWRYIDDPVAVTAGSKGFCDRCVPPRGHPSRPEFWDTRIEAVVHVPADMFVIELGLCRSCSDYLNAITGSATGEPHVIHNAPDAGFERSSRLGPRDEPES